MNLTQFKRRLLDSFLVTINITKMEVNVEYEERICQKNFYTFIGINIYGKRVYLTYGIDYKEDSEFWLQRFKDIKGRGVETVMYLVTQNVQILKRAAEITFRDIKIIESNFEIIDRVNKYFPDDYDNRFPSDVTNLYRCKDKTLHEEALINFKEKYKEVKLIELLLKEKLNLIKNNYELSYNVRNLLFTYYNIRDYRSMIKRENSKIGAIKDINELFSGILDVIEKHEKAMYLTKADWLELLEELIEDKRVRENI